ncbi:Lung seven transmembrane receptor family protein [Thalictrum thalictroides]|uniref:Lung seven transmembrane receptor family protein n=1 Tax=Thalictrum thalictroides TaxID=46969 RepID=A0A7J6VE63_THATH|nr:Lung seven transmembrane receptor family protein [Thalictrum thalictroides]
MVAVAEIRNYKIDSEALEFSRTGKLYVDSFELLEKSGRIQLKVTDIFFPNSCSSNDLSQIGFFLAQNRLSFFSSRCYLHDHDSNVVVLYTLNNLQQHNNSFDLTFSDINKTHDYVLYYQNCVHDRHLNTTVTMNVQSTMYNLDLGDDGYRPLYLSPNKNFLIKSNSFFALVYLSLGCFWFYYILHLKNSKLATVTLIHVLMLFVPFFKAYSLILDTLRHYYILYVGCAQCYPSLLLTFASNFLCDTPLILLLVTVCAGWSLVKPLHLLPSKKRSSLLLVIGVVYNELLTNSAALWLLQVSPFVNEFTYMYPRFFDEIPKLGRWCLLLQAVRSSTDSLKELGTSMNGKASASIKYIQLFRELFNNYLWYCIYQTLVYYMEAFTSYLFLSFLLKELLTLAFYALIVSMLRPEMEKEKLLMVDDEAEKASHKALLKVTTQLLSYLET